MSVGFFCHLTEVGKDSTIFLLLDLITILDDITLLRVHVKWFGIMCGVDLLLLPKTVTAREPVSLQEHHDLTLLSLLFFTFGGRALLLVLLVEELVLLVGFVMHVLELVFVEIMSHRKLFDFISSERELPFDSIIYFDFYESLIYHFAELFL